MYQNIQMVEITENVFVTVKELTVRSRIIGPTDHTGSHGNDCRLEQIGRHAQLEL